MEGFPLEIQYSVKGNPHREIDFADREVDFQVFFERLSNEMTESVAHQMWDTFTSLGICVSVDVQKWTQQMSSSAQFNHSINAILHIIKP